MSWSDLTFTGCTVLTAAEMNQMQANFAALGAGALRGAPPLAPTSLMWTGQASGAALHVSGAGRFQGLVVTDQASVNQLNVSGGYQVSGHPARQLVQTVFASRYQTQANCTAVFSTYMVASMTPWFGDSLITVDANLGGYAMVNAAVSEILRVNLCRDPNGSPVVLTSSDATALPDCQMDAIGGARQSGTEVPGIAHFAFSETSPGSGAALQYGLRFAAQTVSSSKVQANTGRIRVQEWR